MASAMQFRTFIWPNNPESLQITFHRNTEVEPYNGARTVNNIAIMGRIFSGEGVFYGPNAYAKFSELALLFYDGIAGTLSFPHWSSAKALLTDLTLIEEAAEKFVRYRFSFLEMP